MNKQLQLALRVIVSLILLVYIVNKITLQAVVEAISKADIKYVPIILFLFFASFVIKAANYRLLTMPLAKIHVGKSQWYPKLSFTGLLKISVLSWAAGMFAPGKTGELSAIYFLKREGIPLGAATAISVLDKLITISVLIFTAAVGLLMFLDKTTASQITALLVSGLIGLVMLIASSKVRYLVRRFILGKYESGFAGFSNFLFSYVRKNKMLLLYNYGLALLWLYVSAVMIWVALISVGINAPITSIFLINASSMIVSIVPLTLGGLGARETTAVLLFEKAGLAAAPVLGGYLVITIISNILALAVSIAAIIGKK